MSPVLQTCHLTKRFGGIAVVDRVSLCVPARAIYGFLGANGAGKTTTLKLALGLLRPDGGSVRLFGEPLHAGTRVGSLIEVPCAYDHLTGRENLDITRRILGLPRREIDRVLSIVDLHHAGSKRVGGYSLGMRQRLGIARALIGSPRLLVLDEPTNGLDPDGIRDMRSLLTRLPESGDVTLIVSSHLLSEIEQIATHVGLLHKGRLLVEAPLGELLGDSSAVEVATTDRARAGMILQQAGYRVSADDGERILVQDTTDLAAIAELLVAQGQSLTHLTRHRPTLEHLYHRHIAQAA